MEEMKAASFVPRSSSALGYRTVAGMTEEKVKLCGRVDWEGWLRCDWEGWLWCDWEGRDREGQSGSKGLARRQNH